MFDQRKSDVFVFVANVGARRHTSESAGDFAAAARRVPFDVVGVDIVGECIGQLDTSLVVYIHTHSNDDENIATT
jgi:hypothetical protein